MNFEPDANAKSKLLQSVQLINGVTYANKVWIIIGSLMVALIIHYIMTGIGMVGSKGLWIAAFIFGIGAVLYKFFTQKIARGSFSGIGFGGFFSGSFSIELPKTEDEKAKDDAFFKIFMKSFPAIWTMFWISVAVTYYIGNLPIPENLQYIMDFVAVVGLTVSPYFALKAISSWDPKNIKHEWLKALIHAALMIPFYLVITLAGISLVDWSLFSN